MYIYFKIKFELYLQLCVCGVGLNEGVQKTNGARGQVRGDFFHSRMDACLADQWHCPAVRFGSCTAAPRPLLETIRTVPSAESRRGLETSGLDLGARLLCWVAAAGGV